MKTIDVYAQYFSAELLWSGVSRRAALVKLTAESDAGRITYTAEVSFFPHRNEEDYAVSYDACFSRELYSATGRRSKKREQVLLERLQQEIDELAETIGGSVFWDKPLREARLG